MDVERHWRLSEMWTAAMREAGYDVEGTVVDAELLPDGLLCTWRGKIPRTEVAGRHLWRARKIIGLAAGQCEDCFARHWAGETWPTSYPCEHLE